MHLPYDRSKKDFFLDNYLGNCASEKYVGDTLWKIAVKYAYDAVILFSAG